jgi:hypothetical protein
MSFISLGCEGLENLALLWTNIGIPLSPESHPFLDDLNTTGVAGVSLENKMLESAQNLIILILGIININDSWQNKFISEFIGCEQSELLRARSGRP